MSKEFIIGETIGIEIESDNIFRKALRLPDGFTFTHDASVETPSQFNLNGIPVQFENGFDYRNFNIGTDTKGVEVISTMPLQLDESLYNIINRVIERFFICGECGISDRSGIHIHVTLPPNLRILKEVINVGQHLEDVFFLLAGMGYQFRGIVNDSTYCRPITKFGPQCVKNDRGSFSQVLSIDDLLKADSIDEFKKMYGDIYSQMGGKYLPVRYSWLNLYSMFTHGSLEFRPFNLTTNTYFIYAVARLCGYFVKSVLTRAFSNEPFKRLSQNSVYDNRRKEDIIQTFADFFPDIDQEVRNILFTILEYTPEVKLPEEYIYSHLMFHAGGNKTTTHFRFDYRPVAVNKNLIKQPKFTDAHNINVNRGRVVGPRINANNDVFGIRGFARIEFNPPQPDNNENGDWDLDEDEEEEEEE